MPVGDQVGTERRAGWVVAVSEMVEEWWFADLSPSRASAYCAAGSVCRRQVVYSQRCQCRNQWQWITGQEIQV